MPTSSLGATVQALILADNNKANKFFNIRPSHQKNIHHGRLDLLKAPRKIRT